MNCSEWYTCMTSDQWFALVAQIVAILLAIGGSFAVLILWLPSYIKRLADDNFKSREHKRNIEDKLTETELQNKRIEAEVDAQQAIALPEAFVKTTTMLGQVLERHAVVDERNAEIAENRNAIDKQRIESDKQQMETLNRLANSIETMNRSTSISQTWHESRANDVIDTTNEINLRIGNTERTLERLVEDVGVVREKLIVVHATTAQQSTLLAIESGLASVKLMLESLVPKASIVPVEREKAPTLEDTIPLSPDDMLEATRVFPDESETDNSKPNEDLPKASGL